MKDRIIKLMLWVLFAFLLISIGRTISKMRLIERRIENDQKKVDKLREKNESLKRQLDEVESDGYIEKQIRDKLGYSKEGEVVLVLPPDEVLLELAPKPIEEERVKIDPNWRKWLHLFGL